MNFWLACCWRGCLYVATTQVVMPGLPEWGGKAIAWFCPSHERTWQRAVGSNVVLVRFAFGLPPMVYWGIAAP